MQVTITYNAVVTDCTPMLSIGTRHSESNAKFSVLSGEHTIATTVELFKYDALLIHFSGKKYSANGDTRLEITDITIDDISLTHLILHSKQYPKYEAQLGSNVPELPANVGGPEFYKPGTVFNLNGVYELPLTLPIWRHVIDKRYVPY